MAIAKRIAVIVCLSNILPISGQPVYASGTKCDSTCQNQNMRTLEKDFGKNLTSNASWIRGVLLSVSTPSVSGIYKWGSASVAKQIQTVSDSCLVRFSGQTALEIYNDKIQGTKMFNNVVSNFAANVITAKMNLLSGYVISSAMEKIFNSILKGKHWAGVNFAIWVQYNDIIPSDLVGC